MAESLEEGIRRIEALKHDWDGEGAQAYSPEICALALKIGNEFPEFIEKKHGIKIGELSASPSVNGGIDLHWRGDNYEVLLFVSPNKSPQYYGDNLNGGNAIRGTI